jgi:O-antigen ligase
MNRPISELSLDDFNKPALIRLIAIAILITAVLIIYLSLTERYFFLLALVAAPLMVLVVTQPRLALYQYVFSLFIVYELVPSVPLTMMDVSATLVILAALLDALFSDGLPKYLPRLSFNYLYIIAVLIICGFLGYWPELAVRQVLSVSLLLATFLALYHLMSKVSLSELVRWFFILAILHSVYVLVPFVATGGEERSFGFAPALFGLQMQVALPVGLALYLGTRRQKGAFYLVGAVIVLGGLIATQSRAPIAFSLATSLFVLLSVRARIREGSVVVGPVRGLRRRIPAIALSGVVLTGLVIIFSSGVLAPVLSRFGDLFSAEPEGSFLWRLQLWKKALMAFYDHPIFGVGPGAYKHLHEIYAGIRYFPAFFYLRSQTAHNLLLYYLAEMGLLGGLGLVALMVNQFRLARAGWMRLPYQALGTSLALYGWAFLFALSTLIDAAWMYGQMSFMAIFFAALVSRQHSIVIQSQG